MSAPVERKTAIRQLWKRGELRFKFKDRPWQRRIYEFVRSLWGVLVLVMAHRRTGKSFCGILLCVEECLRAPNTNCAIVCKTKDQAAAICEESMTRILGDCPREYQPRFIKSTYTYIFEHNNSKLTILPADGLNKTKIRGRAFRFIVVTEGAFIPRVVQLIGSVLAPTTRDVTGQSEGTILVETTAPDPDEVEQDDIDAFYEMWNLARLEGRAFALPLSDNHEVSDKFREQAARDCGGTHTPMYAREYECKVAGSSDRTAIPEFTAERARALTKDIPRVPGTDRYVGMDPGGTHPTAILWAWYWFAEDLLVIEDEEMLENPSSATIAERVRARELALWGERPDGKLRRFSDNDNLVLLNDLYDAKVRFDATEKDDKAAHVNGLRLLVRDGRIAIHPRCVRLIRTLMLARRSKTRRKGFEEIKGLGHADLLDALIYIVRNVSRKEIPGEMLTTRQPQATSNAPLRVPIANRDGGLLRILTRAWRSRGA